jgi:putative hemin transport protein
MQIEQSVIPQAEHIRKSWRSLKTSGTVRNRDIANTLKISEAELLASECGGNTTRLTGDFRELIKGLPALGKVMALTRNEQAVHEKVGVYENITANGAMGMALGSDIDLRLFFSHWKLGYAVCEPTVKGTRDTYSLQFFDASGQAVHKIFLRDDSNLAAYQRLVTHFEAADQMPGEKVQALAVSEAQRLDDDIDQKGLRASWEALKDTHEFFGLLKKFKVARTQALRLAGEDLAYAIPTSSVRSLLETVASTRLPIMVFVGNRGCIQIHTGPVHNVKVMGPWLNVLDADFNLHLREDLIASVWAVKKPTDDGVVTSVEIFDQAGETIALVFGKRKPGIPESAEWRATVANLLRVG